MSLSALVAFAQEFGPSFEDTRSGDPAVIDTEALAPASEPRSGVPSWVRQRTSEQEIPVEWRLDGPTHREPPPPAIDSLGPDALAFYAPFHFYRNDWGIYIKASGIKYFAELVKRRSDSSLHSSLPRNDRLYRSMRRVVVNDLGSTATITRELPPEDDIEVRVHSNEHPPPHIHVLIKQSKTETRYRWPLLPRTPETSRCPVSSRRSFSNTARSTKGALTR
jgi:hypothetical protein